MIKTRTIFAAITLALLSASTLLAKQDKEKERGWPNHGITEPGNPKHGPNSYASPRGKPHP